MEKTGIERVFKLGDYKTLRVGVVDISMPYEERLREMYERVLDAYEAYYIHQIITFELAEKEEAVNGWKESLAKLHELRAKYLSEEEIE